MRRFRRFPIGLWAVTVLVLAAALSCEIQRRRYPVYYAGLVPVQVALPEGRSDLRVSFTAVWSEPHYVALSFPRDIPDPDLARTIAEAERLVAC